VGQEYHVKLRNQVISKSFKRSGSTSHFDEDPQQQDHIATLDEENIEVVPAVGSPLQRVVA
jgi:hypothetical protein